MNRKSPLSIGIENYKEIIGGGYYYVDKTLLIKELLDKCEKVNLFTRPRRFGKTLALSMIQTFFEKEMDDSAIPVDNSCYFRNQKISQTGEQYTCFMGKFPVISLSLKSAKQKDFDTAYHCLVQQIAREYERHRYILESDSILDANKAIYRSIMEQKASYSYYATSLAFLSDCLKKYHKENVIILIDEYDVPLENSYFCHFYDDMISFIRSLFESAFKTNDCLRFAVITGCLRISKESVFTGLNNLNIVSVLSVDYAEYFGFTEQEVSDMLHWYHLDEKMEEVKLWYDGYRFGKTSVYNPWSVINYVKTAVSDFSAFPKAYWSNTSSNSIVRELIDKADYTARKEIENLIAGESIEKPVHENITYEDIYKTQDNLWNFLFFTGYLRLDHTRLQDSTVYLTLMIPNEEVRYIYQNTIREWFEQQIRILDLRPLYEAVLSRNCFALETFLKNQLRRSISCFDNSESFYHGFMLGLMKPLQDYEIHSNFETGEGRSDLLLIPLDEMQPAVIMEFKQVKRFSEMDSACGRALQQIEDKHYAAELIEDGYKTIIKYGICFCKKSCRVKISDESAPV
ncbi:MAG: AAA family ATPase [Lachnospiraceae bacterium]|nr:AAA family ATPase [Lachnospiraceae bacterium]